MVGAVDEVFIISTVAKATAAKPQQALRVSSDEAAAEVVA
jgi:hypothetical protein